MPPVTLIGCFTHRALTTLDSVVLTMDLFKCTFSYKHMSIDSIYVIRMVLLLSAARLDNCDVGLVDVTYVDGMM